MINCSFVADIQGKFLLIVFNQKTFKIDIKESNIANELFIDALKSQWTLRCVAKQNLKRVLCLIYGFKIIL